MRFDKITLQLAEERNDVLGLWDGIVVRSCSKESMRVKDDGGQYFIVWDDDNKMVKGGWCLGTISADGTLNEYKRSQKYKYYEPEVKKMLKEEIRVEEVGVKAETIPLIDAGAEEFFDRITKEIDEILRSEFRYDS